MATSPNSILGWIFRRPRKNLEGQGSPNDGMEADNQPFGIAQITRVTKASTIRGTAVFRFPHLALPSRIKRLVWHHT